MPDRISRSFALPKSSHAVLLERACAAHSANMLSEAQQLYRRYLAFKPDDAQALHNLGVVGLQMGQAEVAIGLIRQSLEIDDTSADAQCNLGLALKQAGFLEAAEQAYLSAIAIDPMIVDAHSNLGVLLKSKRDFEGAERHYLAAIRSNPRYAPAFLNYSLLLKNYDEVSSRDYLDEAVRIDPALSETPAAKSLARAFGVELDLSHAGLGLRSRRYSMLWRLAAIG